MRHILALTVTATLFACGKSNEATKHEPAKTDSQPKANPAPTDPTASWIEQKGDGFVVFASQAPTESKDTTPSPAGPVPSTTYKYLSSEAPGKMIGLAVTVVDLSKSKKIDEGKVLTGSLTSVGGTFPGTTLDDTKPITGKHMGLEGFYSANLPQIGPLKIRMRVFVHKKRSYQVMAIYSPDLVGQATKFVESFALTD